MAATTIVILAGFAGARVAAAADASAPTHIRFDPVLGVFSGQLPHGVAFFLDIAPGTDETGALIRYAAFDGKKCPEAPSNDASSPYILGVLGPAPSGGTDQVISTTIPKLRYNQKYCFWVTLLKQWSSTRRQKFLADFTARLKDIVETHPSVKEADVRDAVTAALGDLATAEATKPASGKLANVIYDAISPHDLTNALNGSVRYIEQRGQWDHDLGQLDTAGFTKAALNADPTNLVAATAAVKALGIPSEMAAGPPPPIFSSASETVAKAVIEGKALAKLSCAIPAVVAACPALIQLNDDLARAAGRLISLRTAWSQLDDAFVNLQNVLDSNSRVGMVVTIKRPPIAPSQLGFTERAGMYISGSVGMAAPHFRGDGWDMALFVGINLYFAAIDKDIPLHEDDGFSKRFSIVAAYTLTDVNSPSGDAKGALGGKGALLGAALRLTEYAQLGGGAVFVRQSSDNPLLNKTRVRTAPYLSLSIDIDVVDIVKGIFAKAKS